MEPPPRIAPRERATGFLSPSQITPESMGVAGAAGALGVLDGSGGAPSVGTGAGRPRSSALGTRGWSIISTIIITPN